MKKFTAIALSAVLILGGATAASASTDEDTESEPLHVSVPYNGPATIDDFAPAPSAQQLAEATELSTSANISPQCIVCGVPQYKAVKVSGPVLINKKFVRYLTGAWAKSTGYSWSESTTVGATISAGLGVSGQTASSNIGVTASVTKSYSITVNIAASSSKYSKLGLASNYNRYYVKSALHQNGKKLSSSSWKYGYLYAPTKDQYLVVYYQ